MGPNVVTALHDHLLAPNISYRARLGIIVAFTEMLREHKGERVAIAATIDDALLGALIKATADPDRTIRIYSSEFLYDLGDPRSAALALKAFEAADDNGKYNLLLVVQGAYPFLNEQQRGSTDAALKSIYPNVGSRTQGLIKKINPAAAES
jgi:hypothetical protein